MKEIKDEIWVLADNRPGNYSQAVGLAEELDCSHKIVNISYGGFAILPNLLLRSSAKGLSKEAKKSLDQFDHFPKMIISAGRRTAPVALYLKKKSGNKIKIVQIMNPGVSHKKFDFIILPRHDRIKNSFTNVIRSIGALTKINKSVIEYEMKKFKGKLGLDAKKEKIVLLVGGSSKKTKFDAKSAQILAKRVVKIAKNMDCQLVVLNSRRTDAKINDILLEGFDKNKLDYKFFDYNKLKKDENPYLALIGVADYFIATGDSVSMISEVCSTSKPVYIFDNAKISSKKHKKFHKSLLLENYVRELNEEVKELKKEKLKSLDETRRVAQIIMKEL